ncbi:MAG: DUF6175 family protein [Saprospiraceae bacterium]
MNKQLKTIFLSIFLLISSLPFFAQKSGSKEIKQIQPTIMVIPFTKEGQDLRTMLDSSITTRVAIIKVQEAFNDRGFTTVDFVAKLKATRVDAAFKDLNSSDLKSKLIEASGADIYVEVEALEQAGGGGRNSVRLNIKGYDAFTGRQLGGKTISSPTMRTDKYDKLLEMALRTKETQDGTDTKILILEEFLNTMQEKFDEMIEDGRAIKIIFGLASDAEITFNDEVGEDGDLLKDVIDDWVDDNAYKNVYSSQGATENEIIIDEFRIPLRDERGRNLTTAKFARTLRKYCRKIKNDMGDRLDAIEDVRGGTVYITFR